MLAARTHDRCLGSGVSVVSSKPARSREQGHESKRHTSQIAFGCFAIGVGSHGPGAPAPHVMLSLTLDIGI